MLITKTQSIRFIIFLFCVYNKITKGSQKKKPYIVLLCKPLSGVLGEAPYKFRLHWSFVSWCSPILPSKLF